MVICNGDTVLRNPSTHELAKCLGLNANITATEVRDLQIAGAGPSGLAAAVYGASEGLDVLMIETEFSRRAGGIELQDRKLSGVPHRNYRARTGRPCDGAGAKIWSQDVDRQ